MYNYVSIEPSVNCLNKRSCGLCPSNIPSYSWHANNGTRIMIIYTITQYNL